MSAKELVSLGANPYAKEALNKYVATYFREWPDMNKTFTRKSSPTTGKCKVKFQITSDKVEKQTGS